MSLVAQTSELDYEPKVHMIRPYSVNIGKNVVLTQWPVGTDDEHILLRSEELLTVCEPTEQVVKSYLRKTGLTLKDLADPQEEDKVVEEPTNLPTSEEELIYEDPDEYDPSYIDVDI